MFADIAKLHELKQSFQSRECLSGCSCCFFHTRRLLFAWFCAARPIPWPYARAPPLLTVGVACCLPASTKRGSPPHARLLAVDDTTDTTTVTITYPTTTYTVRMPHRRARLLDAHVFWCPFVSVRKGRKSDVGLMAALRFISTAPVVSTPRSRPCPCTTPPPSTTTTPRCGFILGARA